MKRMRTMKRVVRLVGGSLCLLTLMVHGAGAQSLDSAAREIPRAWAAAAPAADSPSFCIWGGYMDDGTAKAGNYTALVSLSNYDTQAHKYTVSVLTKDGEVGKTTLTLAGHETQQWDCTKIGPKACGAHGMLRVEMDTSLQPLIGNLFLLNSGGAFTEVGLFGCATVGQQ